MPRLLTVVGNAAMWTARRAGHLSWWIAYKCDAHAGVR